MTQDPVAALLAETYPADARLVEIGVGNRSDTADDLRSAGYDVLTTDVEPGHGDATDDVFDPDPALYRDADAIYLVRPGEEMQSAALRLARRVTADLAVRPLGTEVIGTGDPDLHTVEGTPVYLWRRRD